MNSIRKYNGQAQVSIKRETSGYMALDIYFNNGLEKFTFISMTNREPQKWMDNINNLINGEEVSIGTNKGAVENVAEVVAEGIASFAGAFSSTFNKKMNKDKMVAIECPSCNASVRGRIGTVGVCEYCGRKINL